MLKYHNYLCILVARTSIPGIQSRFNSLIQVSLIMLIFTKIGKLLIKGRKRTLWIKNVEPYYRMIKVNLFNLI